MVLKESAFKQSLVSVLDAVAEVLSTVVYGVSVVKVGEVSVEAAAASVVAASVESAAAFPVGVALLSWIDPVATESEESCADIQYIKTTIQNINICDLSIIENGRGKNELVKRKERDDTILSWLKTFYNLFIKFNPSFFFQKDDHLFGNSTIAYFQWIKVA